MKMNKKKIHQYFLSKILNKFKDKIFKAFKNNNLHQFKISQNKNIHPQLSNLNYHSNNSLFKINIRKIIFKLLKNRYQTIYLFEKIKSLRVIDS